MGGDRSGAFLTRMYATPMTHNDFIAGYMLPMLVISFAQTLIIYAASWIISLVTGAPGRFARPRPRGCP